MDFAQFPEETQQSMIQALLPGDMSEAEQEEFKQFQKLPEYKRVSKILVRLIDSARKVIREELEQLHPEHDAERIATLKRGLRKLNGGEWKPIILPQHEIPNAFVSGLCPRMVFIYTGLVRKLHTTDDELAMIIGHELSHSILSHTEEKSDMDAYLIAIQLMILTLVDPLGLTSIIFDYCANSLRNLFNAGFSREEEEEADALGLRIMASACYDITRGVGVMQKLAMVQENIPIHPDHHKHVYTTSTSTSTSTSTTSTSSADAAASTTASSVVLGGGPHITPQQSTGWFDSHPSSTERFNRLNGLAAELLADFQDQQKQANTAAGTAAGTAGVRTKPPHCYGLVADLEKAGFGWRFGW